MNLALVQYFFTGPPHPVLQKPHGNSKSSEPYIRTSPSTLQKLKACAKSDSQKEAVKSVSKAKGGVVKANAAGDLPRNCQQNNAQPSLTNSQCKRNRPPSECHDHVQGEPKKTI